jgi:hypothetical protein
MRKAWIGAVLVASFCAIFATAFAALAQATPEFLSGGKAITKIGFTTKAGTGSITTSSTTLKWTGEHGEGSLEAPNKVSGIVLTFTGDKIGGCEVNSPGAAKGEVVSKPLQGELGYISKSIPSVGALFAPVTGAVFGEIEASACTSALKLKGSVIGRITPLNTEVSTGTIAFGTVSGKQEVTKFEGELTEHQLSIGELPGGFECKEGLTTAEKVEIHA